MAPHKGKPEALRCTLEPELVGLQWTSAGTQLPPNAHPGVLDDSQGTNTLPVGRASHLY